MLRLPNKNSILYFTDNPATIIIHCDNSVISSPYEAAVVELTQDCRIQSKIGTIYAEINGKNKKTLTYFNPRSRMYINLDLINRTEEKTTTPWSTKPYQNTIEEIDQEDAPVKTHHTVWIAVSLTLATMISMLIFLIYRLMKRKQRPEPTMRMSELEARANSESNQPLKSHRRGHPKVAESVM